MHEANEIRERLIQEFTENYMEKLFYFCLKKTGSNTEAEDLTQDIALNIITALNKGTIPTGFSAWVCTKKNPLQCPKKYGKAWTLCGIKPLRLLPVIISSAGNKYITKFLIF